MEDKWLELIDKLQLNRTSGIYTHDDYVMSFFYQVLYQIIINYDRVSFEELKKWIGGLYTWKRRSEF